MNRLKKAVLAIGLGILAMSAQAAAPIVNNGSFDSGRTSWNVAGGSPTFTSGIASLSIGDYFYQNITLAENTSYLLTFFSGGTGQGEVRLYDTDFSLNGLAGPSSFGRQGQHSYNFATGSGTANTFSHLEFYGAMGGITIDRVSITTAVPEPESWAMLLVGLTAMGSMAGRRKARQITG